MIFISIKVCFNVSLVYVTVYSSQRDFFFSLPLRLVNINIDIRFTEIKSTTILKNCKLEKSPPLKRLNEEQTNPRL